MKTTKEHDLHLGKRVGGVDTYTPELLQRLSRYDNRKTLGIAKVLPFVGVDIWNAYEFSFLNSEGLPINMILKIMYSADSKYLVESKSLKLYLNSFNMTRVEGGVLEATVIIQNDLEKLLETKVWLQMFNADVKAGWEISKPISGFSNLRKLVSEREPIITKYIYTPDLLQGCTDSVRKKQFHFGELRSRCKVTSQPDFGDLYIYIKGCNLPTEKSLYEYLISFRNEDHFHEEIVEIVYSDLYKRFNPIELLVLAKYSRRGGIDINPMRSSHIHLCDYCIEGLIDINKRFDQTLKQ